MKFIFLRHGIAEKKRDEHSEMDDFGRELTRDGIIEVKEMVQTGHFLFRKLDKIFTSPLVRAVQTAEILYRQNEHVDFEFMPALDSLSPLSSFQEEIKKLPQGSYCFVGHEPHLTSSVNLILNGRSESEIALAKGGLLILEGDSIDEMKLSTLISPKSVTKFQY